MLRPDYPPNSKPSRIPTAQITISQCHILVFGEYPLRLCLRADETYQFKRKLYAKSRIPVGILKILLKMQKSPLDKGASPPRATE